MPPAVSVIVPTYDRFTFLQESIRSVLSQRFTDWEAIIADDGSTDGTREYLRRIGDARVRPVFLEHTGSPARTRAAAVRHVRGEYVAFLDSDDVWLPQKLSAQLETLKANPDCGWSYTGFQIIDENGSPVPGSFSTPDQPHSGWILDDLLNFRATASIVTILVSRSLLDRVGGIDETIDLRSDYELELRLAAESKVCALSDRLTLVREHAGRTTSQRSRSELLQRNVDVFRKLKSATRDPRVRSTCRHQCAVQLAQMARAHSEEGSSRAAMSAVGLALREDPFEPAVWRAALALTARSAGLSAR